MKFQSLRQVFKITEWRAGCVFKTKPVGWAWVTLDTNPPNDGNLQFVSPPTTIQQELGNKTFRRVSDECADFVITTIDEILNRAY
jgi:hypothetical protein